MRVFITGITGPVGSALADYLLALDRPDLEIHAFKRWRSDTRPIEHLAGQVTFHEGDIEDPYVLLQTLQRIVPERIFHLAAQSYPSASWDAPIVTMRTNVEGTINVLEAVRRTCPTARVHLAGSSAAYGPVRPEDTPISESQPLRPVSPYGVSKATTEMIGLQYAASYGLHVVVTRSFNHVGPHQNDRTAIMTFCKQMAMIERGMQEPIIRVGNLEARRDFSHTRDAVRGLWLLLEHAPAGQVYNLCSGIATQIGEIVALVQAHGHAAVTVQVDPIRLRPADEPLLVGDNRKLRAATGWQPEIMMPEIVAELLDYWRARL